MVQDQRRVSQIIRSSVLIALFSVIGGLIGRWYGGAFFKAPKFLKTLAWSLPYGLISFYAHYAQIVPNFFYATLIGFAITAWSFTFRATGHGGGMDLGHSSEEPGNGRTPEKLEYIILWIRKVFHVKQSYWYDVLMLTIIGLFSVAGAAIAVGWVNLCAGVVLASGGLAMPIAYMIGWALIPNHRNQNLPEYVDEPTEIGEIIRGAFYGSTIAIAFIMLSK